MQAKNEEMKRCSRFVVYSEEFPCCQALVKDNFVLVAEPYRINCVSTRPRILVL